MAYPIPNEALHLFKESYRQVVDIRFYGVNETTTLSEKDIIAGGLSINRYSASGSKIEIGSAVAAELALILDNADGKFDDFLFEGAELFVRVGVKKWDAKRWENAQSYYIPFGYFTIDEAPRKLERITLTALDRMVMFDKAVDNTKISFPITIAALLERVCTICGVSLGIRAADLTNAEYVVEKAPTDEDLTYRQYIAWIAEITGTCAFIDWDGKLVLKWYEATDTEITVKERYSSDLKENPITISGVQVVLNKEKYLVGDDTYAFNVESNSLIQHHPTSVAEGLFAKLYGFSYTPFTATIKPMPHLYPLDGIVFTDKKGKKHSTVITECTFTLNNSMTIEGKGETAAKNGYASMNPLTARERAILENAKKELDQTISTRAQALLELNEIITNSLGLYTTQVEAANGSTIFYFHDQPTLQSSSVIYTRNAGGYAWTSGATCWNNGEPIWQYGHTKDGNAVYNAISAYKIQTDQLASRSITTDKIAIGAIGGFDVDATRIRHGKTSYNDTQNEGVWISPGGIGLGKGTFYVTASGFLHAESGEFTGAIRGGTININNKFKVDESGNVALSGNITWGSGASPTQVVYARNSITKPSNNTAWSSFPSTSTSGWHKTFSSGDYFASYTYNGGVSWGEPIKVVGTDGKNGTNGKNGSDASVTSQNVFNALTNNGTIFGCFTDVSGKLYINAEYIRAGRISSNITVTGKLIATNADITGTITAASGTIGSWNMTNGILHSTTGVYGQYSYTTTGADLRYATGYAFTALSPTGIDYVVKAENSFSSTTLAVISALTGRLSGSSGDDGFIEV